MVRIILNAIDAATEKKKEYFSPETRISPGKCPNGSPNLLPIQSKLVFTNSCEYAIISFHITNKVPGFYLVNVDYPIFSTLSDISKPFEGILLDAYGVFWGGNAIGLLPGSQKAMEELVQSGKIVGILSNTTQLSAKEIEKLRQHGLMMGTHFHFLITSGEVARSVFINGDLPFQTPNKRFWLFGGAHPSLSPHQAIFKDTAYEETDHAYEADFIYISVPHLHGEDQTDPDVFLKQVEELKESGLPMVCANPDRFAHEGNPARAVVRQGSIAAMYEALGGSVFYIGKPHGIVYNAAMQEFQRHLGQHSPAASSMQPSNILMVGDTPETDIRGANRCGLSSALVTKTGMMADRIARSNLGVAIQALPAQDIPAFFIKQLGGF